MTAADKLIDGSLTSPNATAPRFAPADAGEKEAAFHAERLTGIGGSDIACIVGLDPYRSAFDVFLEKTGQKPPEDLSENQAVEWGSILEEPVARKFSRVTGLKIGRVNKLLRHPYFPFVIAHIDFRIYKTREGLEVKTAGYWASKSDEWGPDGTDEIPANYLCQVQWYLGCTGWDRWHVAALIGGSEFRRYVVERDEAFIAHLFARAGEFWSHVEARTVPPGAATMEEALEKWPQSVARPVEATEAIADAVRRYAASKKAEAEAKEDRDGLYGEIADYMGECDTLTFNGRTIATWKSRSTGKKLDSKLHAAEEPECHAKYTREGSTRALLIK
jgi:putative phage-type endonuclease